VRRGLSHKLPLFFFIGYSHLQRSHVSIESWKRVFHGTPLFDFGDLGPHHPNPICGSIPHPLTPKYHANIIVLPWPLVVF
jgi:hypothetical protein